MKLLRLFILALFGTAVSINAFAQAKEQKAIVRMITNSASSPVSRVENVKVMIGNEWRPSKSKKDGSLTFETTSPYTINCVGPAPYMLVAPTDKTQNEVTSRSIDIVVTTPERFESDYNEKYEQLKKKYNAKVQEIKRIRADYNKKIESLMATNNTAAERLVRERDSIALLYKAYLEDEETIQNKIANTARELAMTDYQSLSEARKILYDLQSNGEWQKIDSLVSRITGDSPQDFLQSGASSLREAQLSQSERNNIIRLKIEALAELDMPDSVVAYCEYLAKANPKDVDCLMFAAEHNMYYWGYSAKKEECRKRALEYYQQAIDNSSSDSLKMGMCWQMARYYIEKKDIAQCDAALQKYLLYCQLQDANGKGMMDMAFDSIYELAFGCKEYALALKYLNLSVLLNGDKRETKGCIMKCQALSGDSDKLDELIGWYESQLNAITIVDSDSIEYNKQRRMFMSDIAEVMFRLGKYEEAIDYFYEAIDAIDYLDEHGVINGHYYEQFVSWCNRFVGKCYEQLGMYDEALETYENTGSGSFYYETKDAKRQGADRARIHYKQKDMEGLKDDLEQMLAQLGSCEYNDESPWLDENDYLEAIMLAAGYYRLASDYHKALGFIETAENVAQSHVLIGTYSRKINLYGILNAKMDCLKSLGDRAAIKATNERIAKLGVPTEEPSSLYDIYIGAKDCDFNDYN